jgi:hypothetical protein
MSYLWQNRCIGLEGNLLHALKLMPSPELVECSSLLDLYQMMIRQLQYSNLRQLLKVAACFGLSVTPTFYNWQHIHLGSTGRKV